MKVLQDGKEISLGELIKQFDKYPENVAKNALRAAVRAGAVVIQKEARTLAPNKTGALKKSIKVRARRSDNPSIIKFSVSTDKYYANMVEFGTKPHTIKIKNKKVLSNGKAFGKEAKHKGTIAKPFMRPAVDNAEEQVVKAMEDVLKKRLEKLKNA